MQNQQPPVKLSDQVQSLEDRCSALEAKCCDLERKVISLAQGVSSNKEEAAAQTQKAWSDIETILVVIFLILAYYLAVKVMPPNPRGDMLEQQAE